MTVRLRLASITSNTAQTLALPEVGLICIVGGNNVGKSQLLRDMCSSLTDRDRTPVVLSDTKWSKSGSADDFASWLKDNAESLEGGPGEDRQWRPSSGGRGEPEKYILSAWERQDDFGYGRWVKFPLWSSSAGHLAATASGSGREDGGSYGRANSPLVGKLMRAGVEEEELSNLTAGSFDMPIVLDRLSNDLKLRVGNPGVAVPLLNRPTQEYERAVSALPLLANQGDGIQSFVGLALTVIVSPQQVLVIDEPEAFLHPAQARTLGRWLPGEAKKRDKQIVIATHDRDIVLGLLESGEPITIVRVSRDDSTNSIRALQPADVEKIWSDPVLRYSNILQGLFYDQVVICESDADCRFYSAVLDAEASGKESRSIADGTLFVPSGGKQRAGVLAKALTSLDVRVASLPDFDVLRDKKDIKKLLEASGGTWSADINQSYTAVTSWINQESDGWARAKNQGLSMLKEGKIYATGERLLADLADQRVYVVKCGEMEGLDRTLGQHGSVWVSEMLAKDGHKECKPARELIASLLPQPTHEQSAGALKVNSSPSIMNPHTLTNSTQSLQTAIEKTTTPGKEPDTQTVSIRGKLLGAFGFSRS